MDEVATAALESNSESELDSSSESESEAPICSEFGQKINMPDHAHYKNNDLNFSEKTYQKYLFENQKYFKPWIIALVKFLGNTHSQLIKNIVLKDKTLLTSKVDQTKIDYFKNLFKKLYLQFVENDDSDFIEISKNEQSFNSESDISDQEEAYQQYCEEIIQKLLDNLFNELIDQLETRLENSSANKTDIYYQIKYLKEIQSQLQEAKDLEQWFENWIQIAHKKSSHNPFKFFKLKILRCVTSSSETQVKNTS